MSIRVNLPSETERALKARAAATGRTLEALLEEIANREAGVMNEVEEQTQSDISEFERGLDELSEGLPQLPTLADVFSRADIYGEHA